MVMKNRDGLGDPILTKSATNSLLTFLALTDIRKLSNGIRNLQLSYLQHGEPNELWFTECLPALQRLFDFCDELEEEYGVKES